MTSPEQDDLRRYLLGGLTEPQRESIDHRLVTEPAFLEDVEIAEDDLIEDYLLEALPPQQRQSFDSFFLASPEHRQRLAYARVLQERLAPARKAPGRLPSWMARTAAALVVVALGGWLVTRAPEAPRPPVTLEPGLHMGPEHASRVVELRGSEPVPFILPGPHGPGPYRVRLSLTAEPDHPLWETTDVKPYPGGVTVTVPTRTLDRDRSYRLDLYRLGPAPEQRLDPYLFVTR